MLRTINVNICKLPRKLTLNYPVLSRPSHSHTVIDPLTVAILLIGARNMYSSVT